MAHRKLHGRGSQLDSVLVIHVGEVTRSDKHFVARLPVVEQSIISRPLPPGEPLRIQMAT